MCAIRATSAQSNISISSWLKSTRVRAVQCLNLGLVLLRGMTWRFAKVWMVLSLSLIMDHKQRGSYPGWADWTLDFRCWVMLLVVIAATMQDSVETSRTSMQRSADWRTLNVYSGKMWCPSLIQAPEQIFRAIARSLPVTLLRLLTRIVGYLSSRKLKTLCQCHKPDQPSVSLRISQAFSGTIPRSKPDWTWHYVFSARDLVWTRGIWVPHVSLIVIVRRDRLQEFRSRFDTALHLHSSICLRVKGMIDLSDTYLREVSLYQRKNMLSEKTINTSGFKNVNKICLIKRIAKLLQEKMPTRFRLSLLAVNDPSLSFLLPRQRAGIPTA